LGLPGSASGTEKRTGGNTGTALRADSTVGPVAATGHADPVEAQQGAVQDHKCLASRYLNRLLGV